MAQLTQKERWQLDLYKIDALNAYLEFCVHKNEIPRFEIIIPINGCNNKKAFIKTIELFKSKIK